MSEQKNRMAAQRGCLDLAMQACLGAVEPKRMIWVRFAVEKGLAAEDPLRIAFDEFNLCFPSIRRDQEQLIQAGDHLWNAVKRSTWPVPSARVDIEG